jgi:putative aldouronate transport system substrate-binding protein
MSRKWLFLLLISVITSFTAIVLIFDLSNSFYDSNDKENLNQTITVGIADNQYIQDIDTNYYKVWLEKQTGLHLKFYILPQNNTSEYLDIMFSSGNTVVDALFASDNEKEFTLTSSALKKYAQKGYIIPLNKYIDNSVQMKKLFDNFKDYNLKRVMTSLDGNIYYMPGLDTSNSKLYNQILWINETWLKELKLKIPETTDDLKSVLAAFKDNDPNGNRLHDEIPLAGCMDSCNEQSYNFIINSFVYNDPENSRMFVKEGKVFFAPLTNEWRKAVQYLNNLYHDDLLHTFQFTLNQQQFIQLANDPRDILGAFTSSSITDVILQSSPEVISKYIGVAPIKGSNGSQFATVNTPLPSPNGVITSFCKNPETVFHLFEVMLSEDAFLIGHFGEKNVDWEDAQIGDIDLQGKQAAICIKNQLWNKVQNKHILENGPFLTYSRFANGVNWNGFDSDQEYTNARAYKLYSKYKPSEYIKTIVFDGINNSNLFSVRSRINQYTNEMLAEFIQGSVDPHDDDAWNKYIQYYFTLDIDTFIAAVQDSYDALLQR